MIKAAVVRLYWSAVLDSVAQPRERVNFLVLQIASHNHAVLRNFTPQTTLESGEVQDRTESNTTL